METKLTDDQAVALSATTDSSTGAVYPSVAVNNWAAAIYRFLHRVLAALNVANALRVYTIDSNADAVGVRPGRIDIAGTVLDYAGADPAVDGLTNNATTYIWIYNSSGSAAVASGASGGGWPTYEHIKLAEVTMASGVITTIVDRRSEAVYRSTSRRPAVEHHSNSTTLTVDSSGGGKTLTNRGATGAVVLTLPATPGANVPFTFAVVAGQSLKALPPTGKSLYVNGAKQTAAKGAASSTPGDNLSLISDASGDWYCVGKTGTWTIDS